MGISFFSPYLLLGLPEDLLPKIADLSNDFQNLRKKGEIESNFLKATSGGFKLNH